MPHNLVVTVPGAMREVAETAATLPTERQYIPESSQVLFATRMVGPHDQDVLTFTAPTEPGEYPYVCTFPRHWMRMYGVMVVVEDLDAWLANPKPPADPLGQNRQLVRNWTTEDLAPNLASGLRGRTAEIGQRIFTEATCLQCHKLAGTGGAVGPELTDVFQRLKGDRVAVLREILDPSHQVDPKYTLYNVQMADGKLLSGIVTAQDRETVTIVSNPEKPEPIVLRRSNIDEMLKTSSSLMPKGLLDRFTQDEIFELLSLLVNATPATVEGAAASGGSR
jgi:putative heme-binding domain-containing protein